MFPHTQRLLGQGAQVYLVTNFSILYYILYFFCPHSSPSVYCQTHTLCRQKDALWYYISAVNALIQMHLLFNADRLMSLVCTYL